MSTPLRAGACLSLVVAMAALAGCATPEAPVELTDEQVCLSHFENDPVERDRCRSNVDTRKGAPLDVRPQDLPIRSGTLGDE
jgi:hypothetical protein